MENFAITACCGSRLFGLEEDGSDKDYIALVLPLGEAPVGMPVKASCDGADYFCHRLDDMRNIVACASPLIAPSYDSVTGGSSQRLREFWTGNAAALAEIDPIATYLGALAQAESYLTTPGLERTYRIAVRLLGMMWCRYYTGDLLSARQLTDTWRARYFAAKRGELSAADIWAWYEQLNTPSIRRYFESEPVNRTLHEEYKRLINTILEG